MKTIHHKWILTKGEINKQHIQGISHEFYLMLGKTSADSPCFLGAQVEGQVFLVLVSLPKSSLLLLGNYSQHLGDGQPHYLDFGEFVRGTAGDLGIY